MTDGPFRNAALSRQWKRYGEDLVSDAASPEERAAKALHSMLSDVDLKAFSILLRALNDHMQCRQLDLDPVAPVEVIFDNHVKSPLAHILQKELIANLRDQILPEIALNTALAITARDWINITKNRLDEECICARDLGDMNYEEYCKGILRNREAFARIKPDDLCNALIAGTKQAFRQIVQKKAGIDEGPDE